MTFATTSASEGAVLVVPTGAANLASVAAGVRRAGGTPVLAETGDTIRTAPRVLVPGVGTFAAAMETITARGFREPLRERLLAGRPTLGICVGMQVFGRASAESPGVAGLGIVDVDVDALPATQRSPHMGWSMVAGAADGTLVRDTEMYFANSFAFSTPPPGWHTSTVECGARVVAAIERGQVLACQFHPELSGADGTALLRRWMAVADRDAPPADATAFLPSLAVETSRC